MRGGTAALLPTPGDPLVARYWLRNYEVWKGEVDELLVLVNGPDPGVAGSMYAGAGARVITYDHRMGHGEALNALLDSTDADTVVLLEDDAYVREPAAIWSRLDLASQGWIIGSPRWGMAPELEQASNDRWGDIVGPDGSIGSGLWPCFLFARTEVLRATGVGFQGGEFHRGQTVPGLNYTIQGESAGVDTASLMAFVLRDRYPITLDVQHKELWQKKLPADGAPYFHAGGFSTLGQMPREGCGGSNEGLDWAHRVFWWRRIGIDPGLLDEMVRVGGLQEQLDGWAPILEPWISWEGG